MIAAPTIAVRGAALSDILPLLRCPETGAQLVQRGDRLQSASGDRV
jgi:hypothetical protein